MAGERQVADERRYIEINGERLPHYSAKEWLDELLEVFKSGMTLTNETAPKVLYHYSTGSGLLGILQTKQIWATQIRHLNDRDELRIGERIALEELREAGKQVQHQVMRTLVEHLTNFLERKPPSKTGRVYIASFSERGDDLQQWGFYGARGAGYSIGFRSLPPVANATGFGATLLRCEYDVDAFREKVRADLFAMVSKFEGTIAANSVNWESIFEILRFHWMSVMLARIGTMVPRLKNKAFVGEAEWRLVVVPDPEGKNESVLFRSAKDDIQAYIPTPVALDGEKIDFADICVGPTDDREDRAATVRALLNRHGYSPDIPVNVSTASYKG